MSNTTGNLSFDGILGRMGLPDPSVTDRIETELATYFTELGVTARLSSLRHRRIVIESDPTGAAVLRFAIDGIRDRANGVQSGTVDTVAIRTGSLRSAGSAITPEVC